MKICIILVLWLKIKLTFSSEIRNIANWSDLVLDTQNSRRMQILLDTNLAEMDGQQLKEAYYELVPQVQQNSCQILKKIGGAWMKNAFEILSLLCHLTVDFQFLSIEYSELNQSKLTLSNRRDIFTT